MKIIFLFLLMFFCISGFAQTRDIPITGTGLVDTRTLTEVTKNGTLSYQSPFKGRAADPVADKRIASELYELVSIAHDNLTDENNPFYKLYTELWTETEVKIMAAELAKLKTYFKDRASFNLAAEGAFKYFPKPSEFDKDLFQKSEGYSVDTSTLADEKQRQLSVHYKNPFQHWLFEHYKNKYTGSNVKDVGMHGDYLKGWRQLESLLTELENQRKLLALLHEKKKPCIIPTESINAIHKVVTDIYDKIKENYVYKQLKNEMFYKNWLWYTGGHLFTNPLLISTPEKTYPLSEPYRYRDSIAKWNVKPPFESLDQFRKTKKLHNKILYPYKDDETKKLHILQYDAKTGLKTIKQTLFKKEPDDEKYMLVVHNVSSNTALTISRTEKTIADASTLAKELDAAADGMSGFITSLAGVGTGFAKISAIFGGSIQQPLPVNITVTDNTMVGGAAAYSGPAKVKPKKKIIYTVHIDRNEVVLAGPAKEKEDEKAILSILNCTDCDKFDDALIKGFVNNNCYTLDYSSKDKLEASAKVLIEKFYAYVEQQYMHKLSEEDAFIVEKINLLDALLQVPNRSLPPAPGDEETNEDPAYYTSITQLEIEGAQSYAYTVKANTYQPVTKDSALTGKNNFSFSSGATFRLQFSAGVGTTLNDYSQKEVLVSNGQVTENENAQRVRVVAGLHWYFIKKLFKQDDSFLGFGKNGNNNFFRRVSLFAGLGIPKPLENYYGGLSFDLVPGFRLIGGVHLFQNTKYTLMNNQIVAKESGVKAAGPFVTFNIDPGTFVKLIGLVAK